MNSRVLMIACKHGRIFPAAFTAFMLVAAVGPRDARSQVVVDLELALAVDVSSSVTLQEYRLQMSGIAAAFRDRDVVAAIEDMRPYGIAICLIHWSGAVRQTVAIDWTVLVDAKSAYAFADRVAETERSFIGETSIGRALTYAADQIESNGISGRRKSIDVSGDGGARAGVRTRRYRDQVVARGITINGLAILADDPGLARYYRENVIGGPYAFVMVAADFHDFIRAIRNKLFREIVPPVASRTAPQRLAGRAATEAESLLLPR